MHVCGRHCGKKDIWDTYERPRVNVKADNENRAKVLAYFANILDIDLPAGEEIKRRKLTDKLADWTTHVCREDDDVFNNILNIGKGFDEGFLHVDVEKETQWKKYEQEKRTNLDAVPPRRGEMTMNWLRPLRGLRDEDYKELARLAVYDHVSDTISTSSEECVLLVGSRRQYTINNHGRVFEERCKPLW